MIYLHRPLDPELEALLERGRVIRGVDDVVRARALARARTTFAAASSASEPPAPTPVLPTLGRSWQTALAAGVALAIGAAGAEAALRSRERRAPPPPTAISAPVVTPACDASSAPARAPAVVVAEAEPIEKPRRLERPRTAKESYAAEVDLLLRAQAAYAGGDFSGALLVVTEHGRRFSHGRLCEEREALRVRSLASSGHTNEARRAADAFAERFPRSVLLPNLRETGRALD